MSLTCRTRRTGLASPRPSQSFARRSKGSRLRNTARWCSPAAPSSSAATKSSPHCSPPSLAPAPRFNVVTKRTLDFPPSNAIFGSAMPRQRTGNTCANSRRRKACTMRWCEASATRLSPLSQARTPTLSDEYTRISSTPSNESPINISSSVKPCTGCCCFTACSSGQVAAWKVRRCALGCHRS